MADENLLGKINLDNEKRYKSAKAIEIENYIIAIVNLHKTDPYVIDRLVEISRNGKKEYEK